jgi:hypothetical protein
MAAGRSTKWLAHAAVGLGIASPIAAVVLLVVGSSETNDRLLVAGLGLVGVMITASVSLAAERRLWRQHGDEQARLRLDAAMTAGALFNASDGAPADPAAMASGLLALTELGRADLAVALLVDLWDSEGGDATEDSASPGPQRVSDETAVLVLDAALRSSRPNAQLVAAELLCRNAWRLDLCQSLHWPSSVDGTWNPSFGVKTKVLIVDALVRMAYRSKPNLNALQSLAVRLYGIAAGDPDPHVKGCLGMLLSAIVPALDRAKVSSLMQGPSEVTINEIKAVAEDAHANPDKVFFRIVQNRRAKLADWADRCRDIATAPGALASAVASR